MHTFITYNLSKNTSGFQILCRLLLDKKIIVKHYVYKNFSYEMFVKWPTNIKHPPWYHSHNIYLFYFPFTFSIFSSIYIFHDYYWWGIDLYLEQFGVVKYLFCDQNEFHLGSAQMYLFRLCSLRSINLSIYFTFCHSFIIFWFYEYMSAYR